MTPHISVLFVLLEYQQLLPTCT